MNLCRYSALAIFEESRRRRSLAETTIAFDLRVLRRCLKKVGKSVAKIRVTDLRAYLADHSRTASPTTLAKELAILRAFFATLVEAGVLRNDPAAKLARIEANPPRPPILLSTETVTALLKAASIEPSTRRSPELRRAVALRNRACLELLYGVGLRAAEASAALVVDFSVAEETILCRRAKRGTPRFLPIPNAAIPHLVAYLRDGRPHLAGHGLDEGRFLVTERGTPWPAERIYVTVAALARRIGLKAHPHAFRRAVATHLVHNGASVLAVKELLGHVNLETTQRYVLVEREDLRQAVSALESSGKLRSPRPSSPSGEPQPWTGAGSSPPSAT